MSRGLRSWGLNLVLLATSFMVGLILLEIVVRIFDPQPKIRYRFSAHTFYEPIPGERFTYKRREFEIPISYNSHGMRDRERSLQKPPGTFRIALVGDSQVEAKEVHYDSTVARVVERRLEERCPERPVEVLNFGVAGFGTVASTARYRTLASRFEPDLVLYLFIANDLEDNAGTDRRLYTIQAGRIVIQPVADGKTPVVRRLLDFMKYRFQAYHSLRFRIPQLRARFQKQDPEPAAGAGAGPVVPDEEAWRLTGLALETLQESVAMSGARLLVTQGSTHGPEMTRRLHELCVELALPFRDLVVALDRAPPPLRFDSDGHWRASAHQVAAREIVEFLTEHLPPCAVGETR